MRNDSHKRAWTRPAVKRLEAGAAENSPGALFDGVPAQS
jgi:hypothetical protein